MKSVEYIISTNMDSILYFKLLLHRIGVVRVNDYEMDGDTYNISFFTRESDVEIIHNRIIKNIDIFQKKYSKYINYSESIIDTIYDDKQKSIIDSMNNNTEEYVISYKDITLYLQNLNIDNMSILNRPYMGELYLNDVLKHKYILEYPFLNNEWLYSFENYTDSIKGNIISLDMIKYDNNYKILLYGNNEEIYKDILVKIYNCKESNIDILEYQIDVLDKYNDYDIVFIDTKSFQDNIRDLILWAKKSKYVIISGVYDIYSDFYYKILSDIEYNIVYTNRYQNILIGNDYNFDKYDNDIGVGI